MIADLPTVSVIITNWNYASFLASAIDSVLTQTSPVHQCIVVDDGSTDGSRAIIESYGRRIVPVLRANGGQAAAFNAGFEQATGAVIMFLDADDVLKPEAVATILTAWHAGLAAICFGMEVIDRTGRPSGLLPVLARDIDNRPLLTEAGSFTFNPTSGNAFSRHVVEAAFPAPEARWKISADAYLLRIAALTGRIMPLTQVLAQYRVHEANNYYRVGAAKMWTSRRDVRDIVDLARFLAVDESVAKRTGLSKAERLALQTAALRFGAGLARMGDPSIDLGHDLRSMAKLVMAGPAPILSRLMTSAGLLLAATGLWRQPKVLNWLQWPQHRPVWLRGLLGLAGRSQIWDVRRPDRRPRWRSPTPVGTTLITDIDPAADETLGGDIRRPRFDGAPVITGHDGSIDILLAPTPAPLSVEIGLVAGSDPETTIGVDAFLGGELLERTLITGQGIVEVHLPRNIAAWGGPVSIGLVPHEPGVRPSVFRPGSWFYLPPALAVETIAIKALSGALDPPVAMTGRSLPAAHFIEAEKAGWLERDGGAVEMAGSSARLRFTGFGQEAHLAVAIDLADQQPSGWMRILAGELPLFEGRWEASGRITLALPSEAVDDDYWIVELEVVFAADDPLETLGPQIAAIAFLKESADPVRHAKGGEQGPILNAGQQLTFQDDGIGAQALGPQFATDERGSAAFAGRADLSLRIAEGTRDAVLVLEVEQAFEPAKGQVQVVTVLLGERVLAQVGLTGSASISVPLGVVLSEGVSRLRLTLVSVYVERAALANPDKQTETPGAAPLVLNAVALKGERPRPALNFPRRWGSSIDGLLAVAREKLDAGDDRLWAGPLRARLVEAVEGADLHAMMSVLAGNETVSLLARLGRAARPLDDQTAIASRLRTEPAMPEEREAAVRHVILALLCLPASAVPALADLSMLPAPFHWYPQALAAYLGEDPTLLVDVDSSGYEGFVTRLIASVDAGLCLSPGQPHRELAIEVLKSLRPHYLLFGSGSCKPVLQALGRVLERHLVLSGRTLAHAFERGPRTGPRRVGIILRSDKAGPEQMIVGALIKGLDPAQFTPVLILMARDRAGVLEVDCETIVLGDRGVDASVALIRDARLDIFMLGSFFIGLDHLGAIVAHKLAPVQLATTAISPVTTGLSSFDTMISSPLLETVEAEDYVEPLLLAKGQIQGFDRPYTDQLGNVVRLTRTRLNLPLDTVLFTSGAMMRKIGRPLMTAWAQCLAGVPGSALVLYPFAANWQLDFAPTEFGRWAEDILLAHGVAAERLIIRTDLSPNDVSKVLSACDVYLDSFAYAGATTVTEALDVGLPVVALRGRHQRGRQGAGWLEAFGLRDDIAPTVPAYIRRAIALGSDATLRTKRRAKIAAIANPPHRNLGALGKTLGDVLILADGGGAAPGSASVPDYRYLFHHMPKTAGTSSRKIFKKWFNTLQDDYREGWTTTNLPPRLDLEAVGPNDLILGHFELPELRLRRRYPEIYSGKNWRIFSIVRDPFEMALSNYFFEYSRRVNDPTFKPMTLSASLRRKNKSNYCLHFNCTPKNWREVLDHYWFIGTMERLDESLAYIGDAIGQAVPEIPHENATPRPEQPDPEDVEAYLRLNAIDYEIYHEICARLDAQLRG